MLTEMEQFMLWMKKMGIQHNKIEFRADNVCRGVGVLGKEPIREGDCLCKIPKSAILSIRNTAISDILVKERLGGGLGLIVAVLYETGIQEASKWHGYIRSLPCNGESVPLLWQDPRALQLLHGTELEGKVAEYMADTQSDFVEHVLPLAQRYPTRIPQDEGSWSLQAFRKAASWVASRAFFVDKHHKDAMVPLADIFNHKASVVGDEYALIEDEQSESNSGDEEVETEEVDEDEEGREEQKEEGLEGSDQDKQDGHQGAEKKGGCTQHEGLNACGGCATHQEGKEAGGECARNLHHDREQDHKQQQQQQQQEGHHKHHHGDHRSGQWPHSPSSDHARSGSFTKDGMDLRLQLTISSVEDDGVDMLQMRAAKDLPPSVEIYSTYGELGNTDLMAKYGFFIENNPFSEINLSEAKLVSAARAALERQMSVSQASTFATATTGPAEQRTGSKRRGQVGSNSRGQHKTAAGGRGGKGTKGGTGGTSKGEQDKAVLRRRQFLDATSSLLTPSPPPPKPRRRGKPAPESSDQDEHPEQQQAEPLCVLPNGYVNLPVYLVLRVLTASDEELEGWSSVEDIIKGGTTGQQQQQQQQQQQEGGSKETQQQVHQGSGTKDVQQVQQQDGKSEDPEQHQHQLQDREQLHPAVLERFSHAVLVPFHPGSKEQQEGSEGVKRKHDRRQQQQQQQGTPAGAAGCNDRVQLLHQGTTCVWTRSMVEALAAAVASRLARYESLPNLDSNMGVPYDDVGASGAVASDKGGAQGPMGLKRTRVGQAAVGDKPEVGKGGGSEEQRRGDGKRRRIGSSAGSIGDGVEGKRGKDSKESRASAACQWSRQGEQIEGSLDVKGSGEGCALNKQEVSAALGLRAEEQRALHEVLRRLQSWH